MLTKCLQILCVLLMACLASPAFAEGGALLWMVDGNESVIDQRGGVSSYVSPEGLSVSAARVVAVDEDGASVYLNLCYDDGYEFVVTEITMAALNEDRQAGPIWASFDSLGGMSPESYSYMIELGTIVDGAWMTLAVSEASTFSKLANFTTYDPMSLPSDIWMPTVYMVPEPSSALLVLIGGALLALRRRKVS